MSTTSGGDKGGGDDDDDELDIGKYWVEVVFQCLPPHCVRCMPEG